MDPILTDEQKLLEESAAALMERHAGANRLRARRDAGGTVDPALWRGVADAGWLAILAGDDAGGLGLGMTDLAVVLVEAGRALSTAPICAAAAAAHAVAEGDSAAVRENVLPSILSGDLLVVPAIQDTTTAFKAVGRRIQAESTADGLRLNGRETVVPDSGGFLVPAIGPTGTMLCYVPAGTDGLSVDIRRTVDGGSIGQLTLTNVAVGQDAMVAGPNHAPTLIARMRDTMLVGLSAELLGVMSRAVDIAIEYLKVREQFGRPIGSFQALQHRSVDDYIDVEIARALLFQVCAAFDDGRGTPEMAAVLKAKASAAALRVTKSAIQMHGGIGFTDEHDIGLYLKRAMVLSAQYGNETVHRHRYAALSGIEPGA